MALTVQNLRAVGVGVEPASLLPGQIAFNITDKAIYVGDGSNFKTNFDGTQVAGVPGNGWYAMPMDFDSLGEYYVANPGYYGDVPTDQQVLAWSTALNHPIWITGTGGGGSQVYVVSNASVAAAPGATTSAKITAAIGVASPDEGNVTIVTGIPDDVYEGLYFFTTEWVKGAAYAYPSAAEVIYNNGAHPALGATVQFAIDDLDDGLIATTAIANTANSTANSALSIASAALPRTGGTMTGPLTTQNIYVPSGYGVIFSNGSDGTIEGISDSVSTVDPLIAASATSVKTAYDLAAAALARSGGTMTGDITFQSSGEGVVFNGGSSIFEASDSVSTTSSTTAASSTAVKTAYDLAAAATPRSSYTATGDILYGTGSGTFTDLAIGTPGQVLIVGPGNTPIWASDTPGDVTGVNATFPITVDNTDPQQPVVGINGASTVAPGAVQLSDSVSSTSSLDASTPFATKIAYDAGIQGQSDAAAAQATADAAIPRDSYVAGGDLLVGTGAGTFNPLSVGNDGQVLTVLAGAPAWVDDAPGDVTSVTGTAPIVVNNADPENPVVSVDLATTATPGVVQVELTGNINLVGGVINVPDGSTTVKGAVQLNNTLSSTSTLEALTAAQGYALQQQIDALFLSNSVILAGGYDATTGLVDGVTSQGTLAGFVDISAPPTADATTVDHYLICVVAGNVPSAMENGDWLLAVETSPGVYAYQVLGVGARPASASYSTAGIVQLANAAAVLAGTSDTLAITPQALQDNVLDSVTTANSSQIASSTAAKTAYDAGILGQTEALAAQTTANAALPKAGGTMTGTINAHNVNVESAFSLQFAGGVNGSLNAVTNLTNVTSSTTAASATAVKAAYDAGIQGQTDAAAAQVTANAALPKAGGTMTGNITFQDPGEGVAFNGGSFIRGISDATGNTNNDIAASSTAVKNAYALADAAVPKSCYTALGALAAGTGASTVGTLALGTSGQFLAANSACGTGLEWCTLSLACVPCSAFTAVGQLLAGTGTSTFTALTVGSNNQILVADSDCTGGLKWQTSQGAYLCGYTCGATPFNTALGAFAGDSITTGSCNTVFGYNAGTTLTGGLNNTFIGFSAGDGYLSADNSTAVGSNALGNSGGNNNTAVGFCAGGGLTSGGSNTFIGAVAGNDATTTDFSTAVGYNALGAAHTPNGTVAVGANALAANTSGACNVAVGFNAGTAVTTGSNNTMLGYAAGDTVTTGTQNTFLGSGSGGLAATTSEGNTGVGFSALGQGVTSGAYNTALGNNAGLSVTSGAINTLVGYSAGSAITTGGSNTLVGRYAGTSTLANNVVLSDGAGTIRFQSNASGAVSLGTGGSYGTAGQFLASQGSAATPVWCTLSLACIPCAAFTAPGQLLAGTGSSTFSALTVGTNGQFLSANSACSAGLEWCTLSLACVPCSAFTGSGQLLTGTGTSTFTALPTGTNGQILAVDTACTGGLKWLTAQGASLCGFTCTATPFNTALGGLAGAGFTALSVANTAIGYSALDSETSGDFNTAVGHNALTAQNGATGNTAIGGNAGAQITNGNGNTLVGYQAGDILTTGSQNTAIGVNSLGTNVAGTSNVAIGSSSLQSSTCSQNTAVGNGAGCSVTIGTGHVYVGYLAGANSTSSCNNTAVGWNAGSATTGSCNTFIGNNSGSAVTTGSCNTLVGRYTGTTTLSNNVVLSDGAGNIKMQVNENGAVGVGTTPSYGTAGQTLQSAGTAAAPTWVSGATGSFVSQDGKTITVTNGLITAIV